MRHAYVIYIGKAESNFNISFSLNTVYFIAYVSAGFPERSEV